MTRVLVLAAVEVEVRGLARHLGLGPVPGEGGWHFRGGTMDVVCVGPGAVRLDRAAACRRPELVVSAGACGALAPSLAAGDLVVPEGVVDGRGGAWDTWPDLPLPRRGTLLTAPAVVETPEDKARLWFSTEAVAVDMESAPILAWAVTHGLPGAVVRGVSDTAAQAVPADVVSLVDPDGHVRRPQAIRLLLRHPGHVPATMALARGTALALSRVAAALGVLARSPRPVA